MPEHHPLRWYHDERISGWRDSYVYRLSSGEAMASHRPYRPALGIDKALEEISKNRGRLYDPNVVDTCLELFNNGRFEFKAV